VYETKKTTFSFGNGVAVAVERIPLRYSDAIIKTSLSLCYRSARVLICHGATFDISIRVFQESPSRTRIADQ
jgi:hypothetical protein